MVYIIAIIVPLALKYILIHNKLKYVRGRVRRAPQICSGSFAPSELNIQLIVRIQQRVKYLEQSNVWYKAEGLGNLTNGCYLVLITYIMNYMLYHVVTLHSTLYLDISLYKYIYVFIFCL
ncbi:hypothetical protein V1512DRAFT_262414 [Lipomyces arxii]|uniref:uncharacterized protein n=1 Tax=Lipomyces arxii TaxID=56418 RepID=UPI0034CE7767